MPRSTHAVFLEEKFLIFVRQAGDSENYQVSKTKLCIRSILREKNGRNISEILLILKIGIFDLILNESVSENVQLLLKLEEGTQFAN